MEAKQILSVRLAPDLIARMDAVVEESGRTRSEWIERVLAMAVAEAESFISDMERPVPRAVVRAMTASPDFFNLLTRLMVDHLTPEEREEWRFRMVDISQKGKARAAENRRSDQAQEDE